MKKQINMLMVFIAVCTTSLYADYGIWTNISNPVYFGSEKKVSKFTLSTKYYSDVQRASEVKYSISIVPDTCPEKKYLTLSDTTLILKLHKDISNPYYYYYLSDPSPEITLQYSGPINPNAFASPCAIRVVVTNDSLQWPNTFPIVLGVNQKATIDVLTSMALDSIGEYLDDLRQNNISENELQSYYARFASCKQYLYRSPDLGWLIKLRLTPEKYVDLRNRFYPHICCLDWYNDLDLSGWNNGVEYDDAIKQYRDVGAIDFSFSLGNRVPVDYFVQQREKMPGVDRDTVDYKVSCLWGEKQFVDYCSSKTGSSSQEYITKLRNQYFLNDFMNITPETGYYMLKSIDSAQYNDKLPLAVIVARSDFDEGTYSEFYHSRALAPSHRLVVTQPGTKAKLQTVFSRILENLGATDVLVFSMHGNGHSLYLGEELFTVDDSVILTQISKLVKPEGTIILSSCFTGQDSVCSPATQSSSLARVISRYAPDVYVIAATWFSGGSRFVYDSLSTGSKYSVHFRQASQRTFKNGRIIIPDYLENSCPTSIHSNYNKPGYIRNVIGYQAGKSASYAQHTEYFDLSGKRISIPQTRGNLGNNSLRIIIVRNRSEGKESVQKHLFIYK